jgi:hypothetical protein
MPILHWLNDEAACKTLSQIRDRLLEADPKLSYADSVCHSQMGNFSILILLLC